MFRNKADKLSVILDIDEIFAVRTGSTGRTKKSAGKIKFKNNSAKAKQLIKSTKKTK